VGSDVVPGPSFRDFSRQGFSQDEWLLVFSDYLLGRGADVKPDLWQAMFLPDYLRQAVQDQLGAEPVIIYQRQGPQLTEGDSSGRLWIVFLGLLFVAPLALSRWRGRYQRAGLWTTSILLFATALVPWFLALVTAVKEFRYNEILLLYVPTDIVMPWLSPERRARYARGRVAMILAASILLAIGVFVQPLWVPALAVIAPMLILAMPARILAKTRDSRTTAEPNTEPNTKTNTPTRSDRTRGMQKKRSAKSKRCREPTPGSSI
jgi:hypothetical protein